MVLGSIGAGTVAWQQVRGVQYGRHYPMLLGSQMLLTALWLALAGVQLLRRAPWSTFRLLGTLALAAGILGAFANLPHAFADSPAVTFALARSYSIVAVMAVFGGLGHRHAARGSPFAPMLHSAALFCPLLLALSVAAGSWR